MPEKVVLIKKRKAKVKHGFLNRSRTRTGKGVIKRRRLRGRKKV